MFTIGVDIDEVLLSLVPEMLKWHNVNFGTQLVAEDFSNYCFWEAWGGTREEAIQKYFDFVFSDWSENLEPISYSQEVLQRLKDGGHEFFIITSRQNEIMEVTRKRIARHFPGIFTEIYNINHYSLTGHSRSKADVCLELNIDIMIDDNASYLYECIDKTPSLQTPVLFGFYPWNTNKDSRMVRAFGWLHLEQIIARV